MYFKKPFVVGDFLNFISSFFHLESKWADSLWETVFKIYRKQKRKVGPTKGD